MIGPKHPQVLLHLVDLQYCETKHWNLTIHTVTLSEIVLALIGLLTVPGIEGEQLIDPKHPQVLLHLADLQYRQIKH